MDYKSKVKNLILSWEQYKKTNWWESQSVDVENVLLEQFVLIQSIKQIDDASKIAKEWWNNLELHLKIRYMDENGIASNKSSDNLTDYEIERIWRLVNN